MNPQNPNKPGQPQPHGRPGRALGVWIILVLLLMGCWQIATQRGGGDMEMGYNPEFLELVKAGKVQSAVLHPDGSGGAGSITGELGALDEGGNVREFRVVDRKSVV